MKTGASYTVGEIAQFLDCTVVGNPDQRVSGINEIHHAEEGDLVFADHPKYYEKAVKSAAGVILTDRQTNCPEGKSLLISAAPFDDFNRLTRKFLPYIPQMSMTGEDCTIADSAHLSPNSFIGNNVQIGERVIIHPGAYIGDRTIIEDGVIIGPNSVIGHYAFYYKKKAQGYERLHSCGYVHIEKHVEIGASCTIDTGVSSVTRIGEGTKIDNKVHIGHDTIIGKHCLLAANVGISGGVTIKDHVTIWGQVGCVSNVTIGEGATILGQSGISKDLEGGKTYFGSPCSDVRQKFREIAATKKLPEILERL